MLSPWYSWKIGELALNNNQSLTLIPTWTFVIPPSFKIMILVLSLILCYFRKNNNNNNNNVPSIIVNNFLTTWKAICKSRQAHEIHISRRRLILKWQNSPEIENYCITCTFHLKTMCNQYGNHKNIISPIIFFSNINKYCYFIFSNTFMLKKVIWAFAIRLSVR